MADVVIRVLGQTSGANRALAQTSQRVRGLGASTRGGARGVGRLRTQLSGMSSVAGLGSTAIFQLSGAFLAAGGLVAGFKAAVTAATEFESSIVKINTLVGVAESQVREWATSLLELGPSVGRTPQELSEALFVVTSAGERTAAALDVVELAAKASAVGLGETKDIARAVTAALQVYGKAGLDAAAATDILVATVREGNLEASDLAGSLGRVIGIASEAGITFGEVGGFVATFTRAGVSAQEAVTALRSTINLILKPTKQAREALAGFDLTIQDVRRAVGQQGLAKTLVELVAILRQDDEAITAVFPNVRALAGVLATAGAQAEEFNVITGNVVNSQGILAEAFARTSETARFQFDAAKATMSAFAITIGTQILPQLGEMVSVITENSGRLMTIGVVIGAVFDNIVSLVRIISNSIELVWNALLSGLVGILNGINIVINKGVIAPMNLVLGILERVRSAAEGLPGPFGAIARIIPEINFKIPKIALLLDTQRSLLDNMVEDSEDLLDAAGRIGSSWARVALVMEGVNPLLTFAADESERAANAAGRTGARVGGGLRAPPVVRPTLGGPFAMPFGAGVAQRLSERVAKEAAENTVKFFTDEAQRLVEQSVPAQERYRNSIAALNVAQNVGAITAGEYERALAFLTASFEEGGRTFTELAATIGPAVASMIAQIIRAARGGGGGFFGSVAGILGAAASVVAVVGTGGLLLPAALTAGSIIAGAFAGGGRESSTRISGYSPRAIQQLKEISRGPDTVIVQIISPSTGEILDEIIYEIDRRNRTDNIERIPRFVGSSAIGRGQTTISG